MPHQPTQIEAEALDRIALALRPDWANVSPEQIWLARIQNGIFLHAENFEHCIDALISYCNERKDGKPVKNTPALYTESGDHWEHTRPSIRERPGKQAPCQDHTAYNARTCPVCTDEIAARQRSARQRGKRIRKITPSPGILTGHAQDAAQ